MLIDCHCRTVEVCVDWLSLLNYLCVNHPHPLPSYGRDPMVLLAIVLVIYAGIKLCYLSGFEHYKKKIRAVFIWATIKLLQ